MSATIVQGGPFYDLSDLIFKVSVQNYKMHIKTKKLFCIPKG